MPHLNAAPLWALSDGYENFTTAIAIDDFADDVGDNYDKGVFVIANANEVMRAHSSFLVLGQNVDTTISGGGRPLLLFKFNNNCWRSNSFTFLNSRRLYEN